MTTPTREQAPGLVVEALEAHGYTRHEAENIATLARADLEATIAEKAAEIERLGKLVAFDTENIFKQDKQLTEQAAHIERLRDAVSKFLRDNNPEGFGCACEPNRLCGPCSEAKRQRPLYGALSIPSSADALREHDAKLVERIADDDCLSDEAVLVLKDYAESIRKGEL